MKLAYRFYEANPKNLSVMKARTDTMIVNMHGFLGSSINMFSISSFLSGRAVDNTTMLQLQENKKKEKMDVYPCVSMDWRNHGASLHSQEHSLDIHAEDLRDFLRAVACDDDEEMKYVRSGIPASNPRRLTEEDLQKPENASAILSKDPKVVLMAHSMGGVILQHYLWKHHRKGMNFNTDRGGAVGDTNDGITDNVVGAVIIDSAPAPRPPWFHELEEDLQILKELPLESSRIKTRKDAELWMQANASPRIANNLWMIRYLLENLHIGKKATVIPAGENPGGVGEEEEIEKYWKCNLDVLLNQMQNTQWNHKPPVFTLKESSVDSMNWKDKEKEVAKQKVADFMRSPEELGLVDLPTLYVFGGASPYNRPEAMEAIPKFFSNYTIKTLPGAGHFLHMDRRKEFLDTCVQPFLKEIL